MLWGVVQHSSFSCTSERQLRIDMEAAHQVHQCVPDSPLAVQQYQLRIDMKAAQQMASERGRQSACCDAVQAEG
eukprot:1159388-Pelagomonas_calceolata.AAC.28